MPGAEVVLEPLHGTPALRVAVPELEAVELGAIGRIELGQLAVEVARVEQAGLELAERPQQRIGEPGRACRARQAVERSACKRAADDQCPFGLSGDTPPAGVVSRKPREQIVEGADRPAEETATTRKQVALDPVDVRPVRHDQDGFVVEARQIALEEQRDFARMRRPGKQGSPTFPS